MNDKTVNRTSNGGESALSEALKVNTKLSTLSLRCAAATRNKTTLSKDTTST